MKNLVWVLLAVLLIFALLGVPGIGPWQHSYGYVPSGLFTLIIIIVLILLLTGRL